MTVWYGLWHGGGSYADLDAYRDLERFKSLRSAKNALYVRYHSGSVLRPHFEYVNQVPGAWHTPAVTEESCIWLFQFPDGSAYPDRRVYFGPRGGVLVERL